MTVICRIVKRLREEDLRGLLEESFKSLGIKLKIPAIDSIGLRENQVMIVWITKKLQLIS